MPWGSWLGLLPGRAILMITVTWLRLMSQETSGSTDAPTRPRLLPRSQGLDLSLNLGEHLDLLDRMSA